MERLESQSPKTDVPVRHVVPEDKSTLAIGNQKHRKRIERQAWESCQQKAHRTVARARFAFQNVQELSFSEHFCKMRSGKCAPDCKESSASKKQKNV